MMQITYSSPPTAPHGMEAVISVMNHADGVDYEVFGDNATKNWFASDNLSFERITPNPQAISWHRNQVGAKRTASIEVAEVVKNHYGNSVALVTGWTMGEDGRARAFAATPMMPLNPGGSTNYQQREELTQEFVDACRKTIGGVCYIDQLGWSASLPVRLTGRGRPIYLQVTGLTVAEIRDAEGTVLYSGETGFVADAKGGTKPPLRHREKSRNRGTSFWPVLSDQKMERMQGAASGNLPTGDGLDDADMDAFLASVTSS